MDHNLNFQKSTHSGVNLCSKYIPQVQQQRPELPTVTLTWHACKYKVHKLHQRYINFQGSLSTEPNSDWSSKTSKALKRDYQTQGLSSSQTDCMNSAVDEPANRGTRSHLFVFLRYVLFGKLGQLHHLRHHLSLVVAVGQVDQHGDAGVGHVALRVLPTHPKPRSCNRTPDKMMAKLLVVEIFQTSKWLLVRRNLRDIKMTSC